MIEQRAGLAAGETFASGYGTTAKALHWLIVAIVAALHHRFVRRDRVLARMLFGTRA